MEIKSIVIAILLVGGVLFWAQGFTGINLGGIPVDSPMYSSATNAVVNCSGATSTVLLAANSGRLSMMASVSSTDITLCKGATGCVDGTGLYIKSGQRYEQNDGYSGAYSCIGRGGVTSTVGVISS